ncbi:MAG: 16S rRNA (cytosine(1402)-N(4))-methyltransferase RsmH [Acholeplasmataceae bacterium]
MKQRHLSVLLDASIEALQLKKNGIYVDATFGAGGHTREILNRLEGGRVFSFDQDPEAYDHIDEDILKDQRFTIIKENFEHLEQSIRQHGVSQIDGILFDLGMSSMHIDDPKRGFSYMQEGPLDMRMNPHQSLTAEVILNTYDHASLLKIFRDYGDIKQPHKFANFIISKRPYHLTSDVVKVTDVWFRKSQGHSAKAVFQALRIEVNQELQVIERALKQALDMLKPSGRLVVISFHSLEDRIVKQFIKLHSESHTPKGLPVMNETLPLIKVTKKPVLPSEDEMLQNSRSRSAKMRVAEKTI